MLIIERRATANHAEYGPILAHMGPLFAERGLKSGPISAPGGELGATTGCKTGPSRMYRRLAPRGRFLYVLEGPTAEDALNVTERTQSLKVVP